MYHIVACDYDRIGNELAQILNGGKMSRVFGDNQVLFYFVGQSFGQCLNFEHFVTAVNVYSNWNKVEETCVHLAKDTEWYGMVAFWDREKTVKAFKKQPAYEYCVAGIPGVSNMFYHVGKRCKSFVLTELKLYASINKHYKNTSRSIDKKSTAEFLAEKDGLCPLALSRSSLTKLSKQVATYINEYKDIGKALNQIQRFKCTSARAEFIHSFDGGMPDWNTCLNYSNAFFDRCQ